MIRRMADKLAHRPPSTKPSSPNAERDSPSSSLTSTSVLSHRPSISTQATSVASEYSKPKDDNKMQLDTITVTTTPVVQPAVQAQARPAGSYRLSDFIIHRTLGTGSFGRVHLGITKILQLRWRRLMSIKYEVNTTSGSTRSKC
jgi:protein kinase A